MNYPVEPMTPAPAPSFVGQGTAVEQSRAVAEVQAAVIVARQFPRDEANALRKVRSSFAQVDLANKSFFRFRRGSGNVNGETIQFAKELARCWGNVHHGLAELRRDDVAGESEMQAWAWDLETNERASTTFIVPHTRWANSSATRLDDPRDVYENNANNGARRLREMIFTVLPSWFREEAKNVASHTLQNGAGDVPLSKRVADCLSAFEGIGVTADQIESKLGRPSGKWTGVDLGQLQVIFQSIQRGEVTRDEEFPPKRVDEAELYGQPEASADEPAADSPEWPAARQPGTGAEA
ncbi:hypothetical protein ACFWR9_41790 [Streptomyces sp. NPDC058534]|uniref:hypothetical protein n=1 Tax=Streptomyces sp. NPDC058534 TaxID=3346541 RepID=UPI003668F7A3